jgi:hypothetical protein
MRQTHSILWSILFSLAPLVLRLPQAQSFTHSVAPAQAWGLGSARGLGSAHATILVSRGAIGKRFPWPNLSLTARTHSLSWRAIVQGSLGARGERSGLVVGRAQRGGGGGMRRAEQWRTRGNKDWEAQRQERNTPAVVIALRQTLRLILLLVSATWMYCLVQTLLPLVASFVAPVALGPAAVKCAMLSSVSSAGAHIQAAHAAAAAGVAACAPPLTSASAVLAVPFSLVLIGWTLGKAVMLAPLKLLGVSLLVALKMVGAGAAFVCSKVWGVLAVSAASVAAFFTSESLGTQFTCFTGTKVRILTPCVCVCVCVCVHIHMLHTHT